ncbi:urease accessory protein UreD [Marinobacter nanhaiticus D15-8W]|uniref:Urease accessory protein UreD n=1 Tax=Marinobacter nanhaiticus D15-8W TaxID=626887 RepID=N6VR52_9GAMM|nr:urease accessory protein UreD [Marinobacter nanhaiticus]ENO12670.1 urease accessory protein UreD [Marinobacter nanhaiticus D15-8W]BES70008.1 urease accessory protein UreD [Marinobacter nanhaiticus D15-8W]
MTIFTPLAANVDPGRESANDSGHRFDTGRRWAASIELGFESRREQLQPVTRLTRRRHYGPLRVQKPFYPEGKTRCCHVYLLHPPGGLVSGDALHIKANIQTGAHALLTTPAAAKLYKADSHGVAWGQHTQLIVEDGATLEWLPQETLAFDGSRGEQTTTIDLSGSARCIGWEILALGRPVGDLPFVSGHLEQRFRLTRDGRPLWIERQPMDPKHPRFKGPWGQGGSTVQGTLWVVGLDDESEAIEALREQITVSPRWAVTRRRGVLLLRYLGNERNEAWAICQQAWEILRPRLTGYEAHIPRIWMT